MHWKDVGEWMLAVKALRLHQMLIGGCHCENIGGSSVKGRQANVNYECVKGHSKSWWAWIWIVCIYVGEAQSF